jgi:hypothetical protein
MADQVTAPERPSRTVRVPRRLHREAHDQARD